MTSCDQYTLGVGKAAAVRLRLVNKIWNPSTLNFLDQYAHLQGKQVLDVGCGTGILSCEFAKRVGKEGKVFAIDFSEEQLEIAKENARQANCENIEFIVMPAQEMHQLQKQFDFIYCRFLLMHLVDAEQIVQKMSACLASHGQLMCEESMGYEHLDCEPPSEAFECWKTMSLQRSRIHQADSRIGRRLYHFFKKTGLHQIKLQITQPVIYTEEEKNLTWQSMLESMPACVEAGIFTEEKMLADVEALKHFAKEDHIVYSLPYMQIIGEKAE